MRKGTHFGANNFALQFGCRGNVTLSSGSATWRSALTTSLIGRERARRHPPQTPDPPEPLSAIGSSTLRPAPPGRSMTPPCKSCSLHSVPILHRTFSMHHIAAGSRTTSGFAMKNDSQVKFGAPLHTPNKTNIRTFSLSESRIYEQWRCPAQDSTSWSYLLVSAHCHWHKLPKRFNSFVQRDTMRKWSVMAFFVGVHWPYYVLERNLLSTSQLAFVLSSYRIQTPVIENRGRACVTFQYHMYGEDVDKLYVYSERTGIDINKFIQKPQDQVNHIVWNASHSIVLPDLIYVGGFKIECSMSNKPRFSFSCRATSGCLHESTWTWEDQIGYDLTLVWHPNNKWTMWCVGGRTYSGKGCVWPQLWVPPQSHCWLHDPTTCPVLCWVRRSTHNNRTSVVLFWNDQEKGRQRRSECQLHSFSQSS